MKPIPLIAGIARVRLNTAFSSPIATSKIFSATITIGVPNSTFFADLMTSDGTQNLFKLLKILHSLFVFIKRGNFLFYDK